MVLIPRSISSEEKGQGNQRSKLPVIGSSGTAQVSGNYTIGSTQGDLPVSGRELFISNDSTVNLTITVTTIYGTLGFVILPGETINERLPLFTQAVVVCSGSWRWYVRGNLQ